MKTPLEIVQLMLANDAFSNWMNLEVLTIEEGSCVLEMKVKPEMMNGFNITHGGISYSLSDSALAFAANSRGSKCVSLETSISHLRPTKVNDTLQAVAIEKYRGKTVGIYEVNIYNQDKKIISIFKGTVHISNEIW